MVRECECNEWDYFVSSCVKFGAYDKRIQYEKIFNHMFGIDQN